MEGLNAQRERTTGDTGWIRQALKDRKVGCTGNLVKRGWSFSSRGTSIRPDK